MIEYNINISIKNLFENGFIFSLTSSLKDPRLFQGFKIKTKSWDMQVFSLYIILQINKNPFTYNYFFKFGYNKIEFNYYIYTGKIL